MSHLHSKSSLRKVLIIYTKFLVDSMTGRSKNLSHRLPKLYMLKRQLSGRLRKAILRAFFAFSMQEVPMDPERSTRKRYSFSGCSWFKFSTTVKSSSLSAFWVIKDFSPQRCQESLNVVALKI